jgi:hypothetical protein
MVTSYLVHIRRSKTWAVVIRRVFTVFYYRKFNTSVSGGQFSTDLVCTADLGGDDDNDKKTTS